MNPNLTEWLSGISADTTLDRSVQDVASAIASMVTGLSDVSYASVRDLTTATGFDRQTVLDAVEDLREQGWLAEYRSRVYTGGGGYTLATPYAADDVEGAA